MPTSYVLPVYPKLIPHRNLYTIGSDKFWITWFFTVNGEVECFWQTQDGQPVTDERMPVRFRRNAFDGVHAQTPAVFERVDGWRLELKSVGPEPTTFPLSALGDTVLPVVTVP